MAQIVVEDDQPVACSFTYMWISAHMHGSNCGVILYRYERIAERLTLWENWRTESQHQNSLILKNFVFAFVSSLSPLSVLHAIARSVLIRQ